MKDAVFPYSIPGHSGSPNRHKTLNEADKLYAQGKHEEARIRYAEFVEDQERKQSNTLPAYAIERAGRQGYTVVAAEEHKIAYFPIPKCACTSLKHMCYEIIYQHPYHFDDHNKHVHKFFKSGVANLAVEQYQDYFKFTVIRDPIQRFVSGYRNRIIFHNDIGPPLHDSGRSEVPDINTFAMQLDDWMSMSLPVSHHFGLQRVHLSNDLSIFDAIYPIEQIGDLVEVLSRRVGRPLVLGQQQVGGPIMSIHDLSQEAFEKLLEFYAPDYELLADFYPIARIKDMYAKDPRYDHPQEA